MITDFHNLSAKISQLADLTQSLRSENADLRIKSAALAAENAELTRRMPVSYTHLTLPTKA